MAPVVVAVAALLLGACASGGRAPRGPEVDPGAGTGLPDAERAFLADPFEGWDGVAPGDLEERLRAGHRALLAGEAPAAIREQAEAVLAEAPELAPAIVLAAQSDLAAGEAAMALERLDRVVAGAPRYTAAQLARGRAAETLARVPEAFASYRAVAESSPVAAERTTVLEERALEIVGRRFRSALERERLDEAGQHLARLERWAPGTRSTLESTRALATARDDRRAELAAVAGLLELDPGRRDLLERRGELELEVGDASRGLQIFQRLAEAEPQDVRLQERLEQAKFLWRLTLLPAHVQEIARTPQLTRADFAVLAHWLVPRVRTSRAPAGRIAGDILEHPRREEIARVVNLGLMEVDATLHTFSPQRPVRRERALAALLRAVETLGGGAPCLEAPVGRSPSAERVCAAAVSCRLIADPSECAGDGPLSGAEALELVRRTLQVF